MARDEAISENVGTDPSDEESETFIDHHSIFETDDRISGRCASEDVTLFDDPFLHPPRALSLETDRIGDSECGSASSPGLLSGDRQLNQNLRRHSGRGSDQPGEPTRPWN
jgi:hypothetical protein